MPGYRLVRPVNIFVTLYIFLATVLVDQLRHVYYRRPEGLYLLLIVPGEYLFQFRNLAR